MTPTRSSAPPGPVLPLGRVLSRTGGFVLLGSTGFHLAWASPILIPCLLLHPWSLMRLSESATARPAFYGGLVLGLAVSVPHLAFFWTLFGPPAAVLWIILAFWTALFPALLRSIRMRTGLVAAACLAPILWMGLEYFRSELWPLKFSWLSLGYAFSELPDFLRVTRSGVYGAGFLVVAGAAAGWSLGQGRPVRALAVALAVWAFVVHATPLIRPALADSTRTVHLAGIQYESPWLPELLAGLDRLRASHPETDLVVLCV